MSSLRTRWAAIGAAVAITLGAGGGIGLVKATVNSGERSVFVPMTACRIIDTRPAFQVGPKASPLGPGETHMLTARGTAGDCTIPDDAVALSMNLTAVGATLPTFLTVWASDAARPDASSLNPAPAQPPTPNAVTTDLSASGQFSIYNLQGDVHVFADVNGYYADHIHDDRYYTEGEADARFVPTRPKDVTVNVYDMRPTKEGTAWSPSTGWQHAVTAGTTECIFAPVLLPAGSTVSRMELAYAAPSSTPSVSASVSGVRNTPGSAGGITHTAANETATLPMTSSEVGAFDVDATADATVREGHNYFVAVCSEDAVFVTGAKVFLG